MTFVIDAEFRKQIYTAQDAQRQGISRDVIDELWLGETDKPITESRKVVFTNGPAQNTGRATPQEVRQKGG
jgi:hypothetical protein